MAEYRKYIYSREGGRRMINYKEINLGQAIKNFIERKSIFIKESATSCYELKPAQGEKGILEIIYYSETGSIFLEEE